MAYVFSLHGKTTSLLMSAFDERPYFFPRFFRDPRSTPRNEHLCVYHLWPEAAFYLRERERGQAGPQL